MTYINDLPTESVSLVSESLLSLHIDHLGLKLTVRIEEFFVVRDSMFTFYVIL